MSDERPSLLVVAQKAVDDLRRIIADNKRGPDYGWTHPDEQADELQRRVGYIADDLEKALRE